MTFTLTDGLIDQIISAMENQEKSFLLDADTLSLVEKSDSVKADDNLFYELPEWNAADGFELREAFVNQLHIVAVKKELKEVLHSGRGVFKNFRNVLKNYPDADKRWHIFKHNFMSARINEWYNSLREVWGLEKLDYFSETDEDLVHDDFSFVEYKSGENQNEVLQQTCAFLTDDSSELPDDFRKSYYTLLEDRFKTYDLVNQTGVLCRSQADEFAGCITASVMVGNQEKTMVLTSFFVPENFRGLGIGTELVNLLLSQLKAQGKKWILLPNIFIPEFFEPLLIRRGFKKMRNGFFAEI
ncbi:GNAT family N-acetyltransferase [Treponema sp. C6A8]|uniref:GNAT family N-acetyltransferase n=1 Tax=Treponema sp. C6A8 TaxID=1410609 RepID=UPI0004867DE5|nr:GNAT family N-acetyltransferase [Treponema sp. C6A8]